MPPPLLLASRFALPAFVDGKLCEANLPALRDQMTEASKDASAAKVTSVQQAFDKATQAKAAGNFKECVNQRTQALEENAKPSRDD